MDDSIRNMQAKITSDSEADALYIRIVDEIGKGEAVANEVCALSSRASDVVFDFDADGHLLGIEIIGIEGLLRPPADS